jgi:hypothetical protein
LATELRGIDANLQTLVEETGIRLTQTDNDLQAYKTTANNTFMKKTADSNLDLVNTHRVINAPNATLSTHLLPKGQADNLYMDKTTTLNNISLANGHLDMNGYKITNT